MFEIVEETIFFVVKDNDDNDDDDDKVDDGNVGGGVGVHLATASQLQGDWQSEKQFWSAVFIAYAWLYNHCLVNDF